MENYLIIRNKGIIVEEAITLLGASSKRDDDSKIGYFGSGLKYALACFLRNNMPVKILTNGTELKIGLTTKEFVGTVHEIITVNGKETSYTTSMGPKWKIWEAIREIYCNAIDEGEEFIDVTKEIKPAGNETKIYIPVTHEVQNIIDNFDNYFTTGRTDYITTCHNIKFYQHYSGKNAFANIYRKGIRCWDTGYHSVYDYDLKSIDINESRTLESSWQLYCQLAHAYVKCSSTTILAKLFSVINNNNYLEYNIEWSEATKSKFNDAWLSVINERVLVPYELSGYFTEISNKVVLPKKLIYQLRDYFGKRVKIPRELEETEHGVLKDYVPVELSPLEKVMFDQIKYFLIETKYPLDFDIELIKIVNFTSTRKSLIEYDTGNTVSAVLINHKLFKKGKQNVLTEIIYQNTFITEQNSSLETGIAYSVINHLINYLQEFHALPL